MKKDKKEELRKLPKEELIKRIQDHKKTLMKWNNPIERQVEYQQKTGNFYSKHPFKKVRKELAVMETILSERC